jgi:dolichyl-phosphate beta-glucosyltransferase
MAANFEDYEIIFANDGSKDGCDKAVEELNLPCVRVVGYEQNRGKGYAVRTAMLAAEGDIIMFTDADLAYGTEVIKRVYETFMANPDAQMVIGSRNLSKDGYEGYTAIRKLASKVYIKVLSIVGGFRLSDSQCGCKAFEGKAAKEIFSRCEVDRFAFDFECILWAVKFGMKIVEMPVKIINHRESKVNVLRDSFKMVRDILKMKKRIKRAKI